MQATLIPTDPVSSEQLPSTINLSHHDFNFVNFPDPARFFEGSRPLQLLKSLPPLKVYTDVIYTPPAQRAFDGCLYDSDHNRIEASCIRRGREDTLMTTDGEVFTGNIDELATHERPVLYLGHLFPHYGHFLLETLGAWWPLLEDVGDVDQYLIHAQEPGYLATPHVAACLSALQIEQERLIHYDRPMRFKRVLVPQPGFQIHSHIAVKYRELCAKIVTGMHGTSFKQSEQPLFVSRRLLNVGIKTYKNEEKIEEFLESRGVRIIHPQTLSFEEQVRIYNEHKHVWGLTGSGLLNIAFSLEPKTVIALSHHYVAPNFFLSSRCMDAETTYVQACARNDRLQWMMHLLLEKLHLKAKDPERAFSRTFTLDANRVIRWFVNSGHL